MTASSSSRRLVSLDAFRGATIAAMILVNNPGTWRAVYHQLTHADWNGWTFTDVIFPFFLFIVGVSMVLSFSRRQERGDSDNDLMLQILRRSVILFVLGLFLNSFPIFHLSTIRIPGVLQRIAICYFVAALIIVKTGIRGQVCCLAGLLISYWLLMQFYPVPEIGAGVYEPGRNFAAYLDSLLLSGHMWSKYETWDPEGLVSTIPAIGTTLFGVLAGHWLRAEQTGEKKSFWMMACGFGLMILGQILNIWLPINKNIWTSSYSIFMAGLACVCLSVFYWIIDVKGYRRWATPFVIFGKNAIAAYVFSEMLDTSLRFVRITFYGGYDVSFRSLLYRSVFARMASPVNASLLFAVWFLLMMYLVVWLMWKKSWFLKI